ncbi:unnamed protein product [Amaranthus hypochondriacus]
MAYCPFNANTPVDSDDYIEMDYSDDQFFDSDDSEDDPTYIVNLDKAQSKLLSLSIKSYSNSSKESAKGEVDDGVVTDLKEKCQSKLGIEDRKRFEEVQGLIDDKCREFFIQEILHNSYIALFLHFKILGIFILAATSLS